MALYRCMGFFVDLMHVVAVTELEQTAVSRRFAVFLGNNSQNLVFTGRQGGEGWVAVANHHRWLMDAWEAHQRDHRTFSWYGLRVDAELMFRLRNFHIGLLGITAVGPIEAEASRHSFPVYLFGRNDPITVSVTAADKVDRLKAERRAFIEAWKRVVPPVINQLDLDVEGELNPVSSERPF